MPCAVSMSRRAPARSISAACLKASVEVEAASQRAAAAIETKNKTSMSWHWTRSDLPARTSGCLRPEI